MPCHDHQPSDAHQRDLVEYRARVDKLARIACELSTYVPSSALLGLTDETLEWLCMHRAQDYAERKLAAWKKARGIE